MYLYLGCGPLPGFQSTPRLLPFFLGEFQPKPPFPTGQLGGGLATPNLYTFWLLETLTFVPLLCIPSLKTVATLQGIYVPAAPNDSGLTVGGVWALVQPPRGQSVQYVAWRG